MAELTHVTGDDGPRMVDVGAKSETQREATAEALVRFSETSVVALLREASPKGDVLTTARLAGVMAAKRTPELIPLCHPLILTFIDVAAEIDDALPGVCLVATVRCRGQTGVEMEALTAVTMAALTVIDMLKSADRWMRIESVQLRSKSGGRSGDVRRPDAPP